MKIVRSELWVYIVGPLRTETYYSMFFFSRAGTQAIRYPW